MRQEIELTVNGRTYELSAEPRKTLLAVLRDQLQLTGTKEGCSTGDCGACTVLLDGDAVTSCLVLAVQANGREITTVEGIASRGKLHPVQKAMVEFAILGGSAMALASSVVRSSRCPIPVFRELLHLPFAHGMSLPPVVSTSG